MKRRHSLFMTPFSLKYPMQPCGMLQLKATRRVSETHIQSVSRYLPQVHLQAHHSTPTSATGYGHRHLHIPRCPVPLVHQELALIVSKRKLDSCLQTHGNQTACLAT